MNKIMKNNQKVDLNPIYQFAAESAKVNLSFGNTKIGRMINWSTLPGNESNMLIAKDRLLTTVPGTCSSNCNGCFKNCYARRSILQHHNAVTKPWTENTLMIRYRMEECFSDIDAQIMKANSRFYETNNPADLNYKFFRINVSGEIQSLEELEAWNSLAAKHPEMKFGIYSKNAPVLLAFFKKHGQTVPNFCINISEWHGCMSPVIEELHALGARFNVFEYNDSNLSSCELSPEEKNRFATMAKCPAVGTKDNPHPINPKTGQRWHCSDCQGCYTKTCTHRFVYSH